MVLMWLQTGRVIAGTGKVSGHRGRVTDIKWNPFNDNVIASGSDDSTVRFILRLRCITSDTILSEYCKSTRVP